MLQRIYGTSFPTKKELDAHLPAKLEGKSNVATIKARERTDLITIQDEIGPGFSALAPQKGSLIRLLIEISGVNPAHQRTATTWSIRLTSPGWICGRPAATWITTAKTCLTSMKLEGSEYQLKPMNCPFHHDLQVSRSYRDLPIRYGEWAPSIVMNEPACCTVCCASVALLRMTRIYSADPIRSKPKSVVCSDFIVFVLGTFGFHEFRDLSLRVPENPSAPMKTGPSPPMPWRRHQEPQRGLSGGSRRRRLLRPKIDIKIKDVLGRSGNVPPCRSTSTIRNGLNSPYTGEDGKHHQPIMIHRALMVPSNASSGILIEHLRRVPVAGSPCRLQCPTITDNQQSSP